VLLTHRTSVTLAGSHCWIYAIETSRQGTPAVQEDGSIGSRSRLLLLQVMAAPLRIVRSRFVEQSVLWRLVMSLQHSRLLR